MRRPSFCPICDDFIVETTLRDFEITTKIKGEERQVSALAAFRCGNGHIFFLCHDDLAPDVGLIWKAPSTDFSPGYRNDE